MKYLILVLLMISACQNRRSITPVPSPTLIGQPKARIVDDLKKSNLFGYSEVSKIDKNYEVVKSTNGDDYFIKDGVLISTSRSPRPEETSLLYWRYQFKGKSIRETEIPKPAKTHELALKQYSCDSIGTGVAYDPNSEEVIRVLYYENK